MPGIVRKALDSAGGEQLAGGQAFFTVDGQPVVLLGDPVQSHGKAPHDAATMVQASSIFQINGVGVCRAGDLASCGHASSGADWFSIA
ncbi:Zn-binding Pro-Ala-Ala-Arg (PAAR) domain-containing protein, incolved in TypeVI secretion [Faunimonas pinastri]|uniref:Zn-binding Pro-Ala-Ala-Arg (PAAR) domain-containing protein, incolved in TypeVI secretion n=1 Tax=Faunimonas pinastri TaxID=1855383 RepID=A0A1H9GDS4_9HYPH|nr:PAAR domain-containing protein [Faunimonas pinastri]SEQ48234.1 Zn-binding Pro-Ala-Ala-Arg (PAAR) domain-containing protein, incolved in TypeVI secretion [Faunimonas pinastri]